MITTIRYCVGGPASRPCTTHEHKTECIDETCRGCLPRLAEWGYLCNSCHVRLQARLGTGEGSLLWVWDWLTSNLMRRGSEGEKVHSTRTPPAPLSLDVYDARQSLADALVEFEEAARSALDHEEASDMPPVPNNIATLIAWIRGQLWRIEASEDLCRLLWEETARVIGEAHVVAPWRRKVQRCVVPCPQCDHKTLVIRGGESIVRCRRCHAAWDRAEYDRWTVVSAWAAEHSA